MHDYGVRACAETQHAIAAVCLTDIAPYSYVMVITISAARVLQATVVAASAHTLTLGCEMGVSVISEVFFDLRVRNSIEGYLKKSALKHKL